jgi:phage-related protein
VNATKKIIAEFFCTEAGNEPVRDYLKALGRPASTEIGADIGTVERCWKLGKPLVDQLRKASGANTEPIYEVRHTYDKKEYRTLFFVFKNHMILTHIFQKTSQKTPKIEIDLAWSRMKMWVSAERRSAIRRVK